MSRASNFPPPFSTAEFVAEPTDPADERIEVGILVVGAGPAGLACAIRLGQLLEAAPAAYPAAPAVQALLAGIAATLALDWLVLGNHYVPSAFYAVALGQVLGVSMHHVHRVPRCPACSGLADVAAPLPWHKEHAALAG